MDPSFIKTTVLHVENPIDPYLKQEGKENFGKDGEALYKNLPLVSVDDQ